MVAGNRICKKGSYKNEIYVAENHCGSEILAHPKEIDTTYPKIVFSVKGHEGDLLKKMSTMISISETVRT